MVTKKQVQTKIKRSPIKKKLMIETLQKLTQFYKHTHIITL